MHLSMLDWSIVIAVLGTTLCIGLWVSKRSSADSNSFFLASRNMPWWLLGGSMVATTFATDTPNLVTNIVRSNGVSGNWVWWSMLITGMLTTFVYARLWRRMGVATDLEFYEYRYSGKMAGFLRGFRAVYLGVFFNIMIMAGVTLAAVKIGAVLFGSEPKQLVLIAGIITVIFSAVGGFLGVILTDIILFFIAMVGSVAVAYYSVNHPEVGGLTALIEHANVKDKLSFLPNFDDPQQFIPLLIIPLFVQWWSVWYPGSEPGGGGYVAQRMLAAKNEKHAIGASAFFNFCHYALRPWPWILVALASLVVFPDLQSLERALPNVPKHLIQDDLAYSAMLTFLPAGVLGIVVASLVSAYVSTISTSLNWGASYIVNDVYGRFVSPNASEKKKVFIGRLSTVLLMLVASSMALLLESALQAFRLLLTIGAGTGLLFLLRWFWMRINAWSEITAMVASFLISLAIEFGPFDHIVEWQKLVYSIFLTTVCWVTVTLLSKGEQAEKVDEFRQTVDLKDGEIKNGMWAALFATVFVYSTLFSAGAWLFGRELLAVGLAALGLLTLVLAYRKESSREYSAA
ncbi:sodium:solute symporter family protein [Pseudoteredinibacter isoporae]|uniref:Na+/proline symporter n=1 Tax=Pseudoteredinibacter isoporae TaxID=570281 RepID=A0A7X0JQY1_9GAMM|nr:sodium:solute symporter family protein [Pseudoteredinibacter isoporae]MBB6520028.1 Na+/proline symporter [Pseudoteredinibacter isoporae]NHO85600.1 Na+:solute symporter [Pseudoteredinibacter isoporae]NIB25948.1 Na+:solute symporter [Pseudoteredinibacter isoporae]